MHVLNCLRLSIGAFTAFCIAIANVGLAADPEPLPAPRSKPLTEIRTWLQPPAGKLPVDRSAERLVSQAADGPPWHRVWHDLEMNWAAADSVHQPLYFAQPRREVLGRTRRPAIQPALSGAHFFVNLAVLPAKLAIVPPYRLVPALPYRPR